MNAVSGAGRHEGGQGLRNVYHPISRGVLRRQSEITIPDRHLGLIPTAEMANLPSIIERLAYLGEVS